MFFTSIRLFLFHVENCHFLQSFRLQGQKLLTFLILKEYQFNEARINQALEGIYSTVVLRDILQRNHQADQGMLQKLIMFLCSNIGSITSPNSIGNVLSNEGDIPSVKGRNIASKTVEKYFHASQRIYFLFCRTI